MGINPINIIAYWVLTGYPIRPNYEKTKIPLKPKRWSKYIRNLKNDQNTPKPKKWPNTPET